MESHSSKKRIQGAAARAKVKARRTTASASPTYEEAYTCAGLRVKNATPEAPAAARARVVLEQPGGPCNKIPRGGFNPSCLKDSFFRRGHSIACRNKVYVKDHIKVRKEQH